MKKSFKVGDRVVAMRTIAESGGQGDPKAKFPSESFVHATRGDVGVVVGMDGDGVPTVRFIRKGHATIVDASEIAQLRDLPEEFETAE